MNSGTGRLEKDGRVEKERNASDDAPMGYRGRNVVYLGILQYASPKSVVG